MKPFLKRCGLALPLLLSSVFAQEAITPGTYEVLNIKCGNQPANEAVRKTYLPPNSVAIIFNGDATGAFLDVVNAGSCTKNIPLRYQSTATFLTAYFNGPIGCVPEACDPACGLDLPISVGYEYEVQNDQILILRSEVESADTTCTAAGQQNPIEYRLRRL